MRNHYTPLRKSKLKKNDHTKYWQGCGGWNPHTSYTAGGNAKCSDYLGKKFSSFLDS